MLVLGLIELPLWLILTLVIIVTLYILGTRNHDYFKKRGIPGPKPWPFIGTIYAYFTSDMFTMHLEQKKKHGKVYGLLNGTSPEYVIFDEEMLSQITVKQFQNFSDRRKFMLGDPAFDNMITVMDGAHWKYTRGQMTPAFTTGKLRLMSSEINRSAKTFAQLLISNEGPFEARDPASAFTMEVIASTAFGLRIDAQGENKNCPFIVNAQVMTNLNIKSFTLIVMLLYPKAVPYFTKMGFPVVEPSSIKFFTTVVEQTLKGRAEGDQKRADFLQLMIKAQQGQDIRDSEEKEKDIENERKTASKETGLTKDEILANSLIFFTAGYDGTSTTVSMLMYLLACSQDCQERVFEEIDSVLGDKEDVDYDSAMKMPYLDQCIQETLRLYPPGFATDRVATVDTDVCGYKIEKGSVVTIPIMSIHLDPEIWPEPKKFDPDRFSPEKKANMNPFHWLPFGYGPRNCIGMRLSLFEVKVAIATLLRTHKVVTCEKTQIPLKLGKTKSLRAEKGIWLEVEKREK